MFSYKLMDQLINDGLCYVCMDMDNSTVSLDVDSRKYYDNGLDFHYIEYPENIITFPLGENLFNFLSLTDDTLKIIQTLSTKNSRTWNGKHEDDEERKYIASLECVYLYILYYSSFREQFGSPYRSNLFNIKKEFEFALNFCCNDSFIPELKELSAIDKYYVYSELYNDNILTNIKYFKRNGSIFLEANFPTESLNAIDRMDYSNDKYRNYNEEKPIIEKPILSKQVISELKNFKVSATTRYQYTNLEGYLMEELYALIQLNARVKKCARCNKYFITKGNYATEYCDRIMSGEKFSCKKMAAIHARKEKVKSNPILQEYQRAYKRMYARVSGKKLSKKDFKEWTDNVSCERDRIIESYGTNPPQEIIESFKKYLNNH